MKREIKFRVWYKGSQYPLCRNDLEEYEKPQMIYEVQNLYDGMGIEKNSILGGYSSFGSLLDNEDFVVMQFLGLKDKNGKEIYEGDIVKMHQFLFDGNEVEEEHIGIVSFDEETASFNFSKIKGKFYSEYTGYEEGKDIEGTPICNFYGLHEESFEVVGNIYENPEQLNNDNNNI